MNAVEQRRINFEKRTIALKKLIAGILIAGTSWHIPSVVDEQKSIVLAATLLATGVLCVSLYTRLRVRKPGKPPGKSTRSAIGDADRSIHLRMREPFRWLERTDRVRRHNPKGWPGGCEWVR